MRARPTLLAVLVLAASLAPAWRVHAQEVAPAAPTVPAPRPPTTTTNEGIVALGIAVWTTTYFPSLLIGLLDRLGHSGCTGVDAVFDAPFGAAGGAVALLACFHGEAWTSEVALGLAFGLGQIVGLVLAILGDTVLRLGRDPVPYSTWSANGLAIAF
jgi:hypothetical protein